MLLCFDLVYDLINELGKREAAALTLNTRADGNGSFLHFVLANDDHIGDLLKLCLTDTITELFVAVVQLCANTCCLTPQKQSQPDERAHFRSCGCH